MRPNHEIFRDLVQVEGQLTHPEWMKTKLQMEVLLDIRDQLARIADNTEKKASSKKE